MLTQAPAPAIADTHLGRESCPQSHPLKPFYTPVDGYELCSLLYPYMFKIFMQSVWENNWSVGKRNENVRMPYMRLRYLH